jgi:thiamine biosynthesis lipoprotein
MPKTFTNLTRHALNGPTMGTRWSALFHMPKSFDPRPAQQFLAAEVTKVDRQMSSWKPNSDVMRLNAAVPGEWVDVPEELLEVLSYGLRIGRISGGAFDIGVGDAVVAWGFGTAPADPERIRAALAAPRRPAHEVLEIDADNCRVRKLAPLSIDLSGIAKGYGVDRLAGVIEALGIPGALVGLDGELRAIGLQPDGTSWTIAVECPDHASRVPSAILALENAAVATSGDYRHWVELCGRRLSHTMDPRRGRPLATSPASVTVVAATCIEADAWATALMVKGTLEGATIARRMGIHALFLDRGEGGLCQTATGLFAQPRASTCENGRKGRPHEPGRQR